MYIRAVSEAIENAKEVIFIEDWWLVKYKRRILNLVGLLFFFYFFFLKKKKKVPRIGKKSFES